MISFCKTVVSFHVPAMIKLDLILSYQNQKKLTNRIQCGKEYGSDKDILFFLPYDRVIDPAVPF